MKIKNMIAKSLVFGTALTAMPINTFASETVKNIIIYAFGGTEEDPDSYQMSALKRVKGYLTKLSPEMIIEQKIDALVASPTVEGLEEVRTLVNALPEGETKVRLQARLNVIMPGTTFTEKSATANVDVYIKCDNMLSMSLSTNSVTFESFSGVEDLPMPNAVELTIDSSLAYDVKASLATKIENKDKNKEMRLDILNIKTSDKTNDEYQTFAAIETPITLVDTAVAGNNKTHNVDLMLKGNIAFDKDVYKTTIKFEASQK